MMKPPKPMKPTTKGERTWVDNHGYRMPPHVSPTTIEVVETIMRTFPLRAKVKLEVHKFTNTYMMSIFLTFSFRGAVGVLRRRKSKTRMVLKAHIGMLRSVWAIHNTNRPTNQSFYSQNNHLLEGQKVDWEELSRCEASGIPFPVLSQ